MPTTNHPWNTGTGTGYVTFNTYENAYRGMIFGDTQAKTTPPPKVQLLKNSGTSNCCGANFLEFFPQDTGGGISAETVKNVAAEVKEKKQFFNSMQLVILNHKQKKHYHKILIDNEFEELYTCNHPGHGNDITLYAWRRYKPKYEVSS